MKPSQTEGSTGVFDLEMRMWEAYRTIPTYSSNPADHLDPLVNVVKHYGTELLNAWNLSREKMPDFDGEYLVAGWLHHECGNVTQFQKVVTCRFNQWVKDDIGEQMTYWRELLPMPKETDIEKENLQTNGQQDKD